MPPTEAGLDGAAPRCVCTVTKAAEKMLPIIGISQQGVTNEKEARRRWVSQNVKKLREAALRMNKGGAVEAAFAPKGNTQLIPNSYQMSRGSLSLASALVPKTLRGNVSDGPSFSSTEWGSVGARAGIVLGQKYTAFQLWKMLLGIDPGDQLTFPQIYGEGEAQTLTGANGSTLDLTRYTDFVAPRIVFKTAIDNDPGVTINEAAGVDALRTEMQLAIDEDNTWWDPVDIVRKIDLDVRTAGEERIEITETYDYMFGINDDDWLRAIGCIRSHKNISTGKWEYSTSSLVCVWGPGANTDEYFGFTLINAADTYKANVVTDADGNFLQRGTDSNIVPDSFM